MTDALVVFSYKPGLRPGEPVNLDIKDYQGRRLHIRSCKHSSKEYVNLDDWAKQLLDDYLNWRQSNGETQYP